MMEPGRAHFRLTVLNPGGRDPEQHLPEGADETTPPHAPINFHAYAACTSGCSHCEPKLASAEGMLVLLLLPGDFRTEERALIGLHSEGRAVAVSLEEPVLHQIA